MIDYANTHMAYADLCHGGRYRIDVKAVKDLPDFLTEEDRKDLAKRIEGPRRIPPEKCSEARTKYTMGELVDDINRMSDFVQILIDGYRSQVVGGAQQ